MSSISVYEIGENKIKLSVPPGVMPPSPYSIFLAENIPNLSGKVVADVGSGCGIQGIIAKMNDAKKVFVLDNNPNAIQATMKNVVQNGFSDGFIPVEPGDVLAPLPLGIQLDTIICNPASLPMPEPDSPDSPYFSGADGRRMIERLINQAQARLRHKGEILMTHTSLADVSASQHLMISLGFIPRIVAQKELNFRHFYNQNWFDMLGGEKNKLYITKQGEKREILYIIGASLNIINRGIRKLDETSYPMEVHLST